MKLEDMQILVLLAGEKRRNNRDITLFTDYKILLFEDEE